jgi:hypothetical protein
MIDSPYRGYCGHSDEPERFCPGCFHGEHRGRCAECGRRCIAARYEKQIIRAFGISAYVLGLLVWPAGLARSGVEWLVAIAAVQLWLAFLIGLGYLLTFPFAYPLRRLLSRIDYRLHGEFERFAVEEAGVRVDVPELASDCAVHDPSHELSGGSCGAESSLEQMLNRDH